MATIKTVTHKARIKTVGSKTITLPPKTVYKVRIDKANYKRVNRTYDKIAIAKKDIAIIEAAMDAGTWDEVKQEAIKAGDTVLTTLIVKYLKDVSSKKKGGIQTFKYETATLNEIGRSSIGKMDIFKIQTSHIDSLKTFLLERQDKAELDENGDEIPRPELKENTVNRKLTVLQGLFTQAKLRWNYNVNNPVRGMLYKDADNERNRELAEFEIDEVKRVLGELKIVGGKIKNPYPLFLFEIAIETGGRRRELFENTWGNVDFDKRVLTIPKPIAKSRRERKIPLSPKAIEAFRTIYDKDKPKPTDFLTPITIDSFKSAWRRAMGKCEVQDVRFHDSRHVAITNLAKVYPRCQSLAKITGHRKLDTLLRYYDETDKERVEQMDEFHKPKPQ